MSASVITGSALTVTATEGTAIPTGTPLGVFTDTNTAQTAATYTANTSGPGSIVVNWGDGTATSLVAANVGIATNGTTNLNVTLFTTANLTHTYAEAGTYTISIVVLTTPQGTFAAGTAAIISGAAVVADAPLAAGTIATPVFSVNVNTPITTSTVLVNFNDGNPGAPGPSPATLQTEYSAVIDWGDGSP